MNMQPIWYGWFLVIIMSFTAFEAYAIYTGSLTLSAFVRALSVAWPVLPFVIGLGVGGLAVHFWWTYNG